MANKLSACTSILIGKKASIDGTIMIGRNEDAKAAWPKHMVVHQHGEMPTHFISKETKLELDCRATVPATPLRRNGPTRPACSKRTGSTSTTSL